METRSALWSWSCVGSLMMFAAALIELAAAGAPQESQLQGSAPRSGGGENFLWFLPVALGAVLMLTFLVVLCVSRVRGKTNQHSYRGATTTTQPFLCTAVADRQVAAAPDHVYINQPVNQSNREGQAGSSAVRPIQSGRLSPHYASLTPGGGLLQNVYEPSNDMGTREADPDQAQRGYEVPCVSVKQQENGMDETGTPTSLYTNESCQSRDVQLHAYYHIPRQERAELCGTETDGAGQIRSISPPAVPLPPVPDRPAVMTEDALRMQQVQNEPRPTAIHPRKGPLLSLPSWMEASQSMSKPSPLPSPVSTITGRGGEEKEIKYKEPPSTEHLIHENFRALKCPIVPSRELRFGEKLGEGYFATVHSAVWSSPHGQFEVAVKKLKSSASAEVRVRFLQEALIMAQFLHPNIVQLCGMTQDTTQGIILELLPNGSLKSYLETLRKHALEYPEGQIASALLLFAQQIASGMNYLANKDFVHRDLAARNILLDADYVCKIGDFGLARGIAGESYYKAKSGHIPVKWTAPEALEFNRYTSASDVWSYGVLLFEMWSLGRMPMADKKNAEISTHLNGGYRMSPPPGCSRGIYKLMIKCWHPDPEKRPTFGMVYGAIEVKGLALLAVDSAAIRSSTVHTNAHVLGAPLVAGEGLYRDLQVAYR